jgi:hypothetical protein
LPSGLQVLPTLASSGLPSPLPSRYACPCAQTETLENAPLELGLRNPKRPDLIPHICGCPVLLLGMQEHASLRSFLPVILPCSLSDVGGLSSHRHCKHLRQRSGDWRSPIRSIRIRSGPAP